MNALKILALCIAAAMICAMLRGVHPQMASAVAIAAGVAAMTLSRSDIRVFSDAIAKLDEITGNGKEQLALMKICGVAMVAEFASDICREAGEEMLAKRIDTGVRIGIVASAIPTAGAILTSITEMLP